MRNYKNLSLGAILKGMREAAGLSQQQVFEGVISPYYSQIEGDKAVKQPNAQILVGLADKLNADPNILLRAAGYNLAQIPWHEEIENLDREVIAFFSTISRSSQRKIVNALKIIVSNSPNFIGSVLDETNGSRSER